MANTTWNPSDKAAGLVLSGSNLIATWGGSGTSWARAIDKQVTGKFYWEITATTIVNLQTSLGIAASTVDLTNGFAFGAPSAPSCGIQRGGVIYSDGVSTGIGLGTIANGTVVCFACDVAARRMWIRLGAAGNWNNNATYNPATGVGGISISLGGGIATYPAIVLIGTTETVTANFGDTAFTGAVPAGFTSGFTAGATVSTNTLATQVSVEEWLTTNPDAQVTQVGVEEWFVPNAPFQVTQAALEHWFTTSPPLQVTQVALEQWATVTTVLVVAPGLIPSGEVVFPPTTQITTTTLTVGFVPGSEAVYPPTLASGRVTITPGRVPSSEIIYAPTLVGQGLLRPGLIPSSEIVFPPHLVPGAVTVTPDFIFIGELMFPLNMHLMAFPPGNYGALFNVPPGRYR